MAIIVQKQYNIRFLVLFIVLFQEIVASEEHKSSPETIKCAENNETLLIMFEDRLEELRINDHNIFECGFFIPILEKRWKLTDNVINLTSVTNDIFFLTSKLSNKDFKTFSKNDIEKYALSDNGYINIFQSAVFYNSLCPETSIDSYFYTNIRAFISIIVKYRCLKVLLTIINDSDCLPIPILHYLIVQIYKRICNEYKIPYFISHNSVYLGIIYVSDENLSQDETKIYIAADFMRFLCNQTDPDNNISADWLNKLNNYDEYLENTHRYTKFMVSLILLQKLFTLSSMKHNYVLYWRDLYISEKELMLLIYLNMIELIEYVQIKYQISSLFIANTCFNLNSIAIHFNENESIIDFSTVKFPKLQSIIIISACESGDKKLEINFSENQKGNIKNIEITNFYLNDNLFSIVNSLVNLQTIRLYKCKIEKKLWKKYFTRKSIKKHSSTNKTSSLFCRIFPFLRPKSSVEINSNIAFSSNSTPKFNNDNSLYLFSVFSRSIVDELSIIDIELTNQDFNKIFSLKNIMGCILISNR